MTIQRRGARHAFTLVEMLVVAVIIAILLSLVSAAQRGAGLEDGSEVLHVVDDRSRHGDLGLQGDFSLTNKYNNIRKILTILDFYLRMMYKGTS